MRRWTIPAAHQFAAVVSLTFTLVTLGAVAMQYRQHERAANFEARRDAEQLAATIVQTISISPELFKPDMLNEIINRFSIVAGDIDRISISDNKGVIVADYRQRSLGRKSKYVTAKQTYDSGLIETNVSSICNWFSLHGAGAHIEVSARLLGPFDTVRDTNLLGIVTVDASRHTTIGAIDFPLIGVIGLVLAIGFLFTAILFRTHRRLLRETSLDLTLARDRADDANSAKSEFLANMSHEIRTPISGVLGMADLLSGTRLADDQRTFVDTILTSSHALLDVINNVLDFSKIDAKKLELHAKPFVLSDIADEPARLMAQMAAEKGVALMVRTAPGLPSHLFGDLARLRQVVINLVANAVKFTDAGQVVIDVSGATIPGDRCAIRVEVRDTGAGIPNDRLPEVFEKFRRIGDSSIQRQDGAGLGLSISKGLVELMGGEIGVSSTLGEGSTFWLTLTLPLTSSGAEPHPVPALVHDLRALVIDANETSRDIHAELLGSWRMRMTAAATGREGLRLLEAAQREGAPFDLVIIDKETPDMDGVAILKRIRRTPELADIPVILHSAVACAGPDEDVRRAADAILPKPVRGFQLLEAIATTLDPTHSSAGGGGGQAAPTPTPSDPPGEAAVEIRVLVAEDNEVNAFVAQQAILGLGLIFERAVNGAEAAEQFRRAPPSMVLMDVSMPVMNGYDATRRIRAFETESGLPRTPIIGLTAHALEGDRDKCLDVGMDDYIAKPYPVEALRKILSKWLRDQQDKSAAKADPAAAA